jgi:two-component system chemotaxis sensor kinase CheA
VKRNDLAARLLQTFLGELDEQVQALNADLLALEAAPADQERLKAVFRVAHALKGAARAANVPLIEGVCHHLEGLLANARDQKTKLTPQAFHLLFSSADALGEAGARLKRGASLAGSPLEALVQTLTAGRAPDVSPLAGPPLAAPPAPAPEARGAAPAQPPGGDGQLRIEAAKLDALLGASNELLVTRGQLATHATLVEEVRDLASRTRGAWRQGSRRIRLALERAGAAAAPESLTLLEDNLQQLVLQLGDLARSARDDAHQVVKAADAVQRQVRELRMRPFADACESLPRTVRDLASAGGKEIDLRLVGGEVEADRAVLDGLRDALLQLVRNAVDHGIETPGAREGQGKPRRGTITVSAALHGDRLSVTVGDDGAGLDLPAIRKALARQGRPAPEADHDVVSQLLRSGVSTRSEAGVVSGRGVGLDIVREAVHRVRGTLDVSWEPSRGTRFVIQCPPSLVSVRVVLVALGSQVLAIPTTHVERLLRIRGEEIRTVEGQQVIPTAAGPVRLVPLWALMAAPVERSLPSPLPAVLLGTGSRRLAVAVDQVIAEDEVVLRPLRLKGGGSPLIGGGALWGSGRMALVLNPEALIAAGLGAAPGKGVTTTAAEPVGPARRRILVVDDSITTRTLEQSILEAAGYDVLTAVDGDDGWRRLQEEGCDLVVADIEMPRLDGFQLCEAIRGSKRFKELPVVLVTAMETPEHRARGLEVGADGYIGKSSFDQQHLLDTIQQLLG